MTVTARECGSWSARERRLRSVLVSLLLVAGCTHEGARRAGRAGPVAFRSEVLHLDAGWARTLAARDPAAFASVVSEDALFAGRGGFVRGREGVRAAWSRWFEPGAPSFVWSPDGGGASAAGDLAWSTGTFRIEETGAPARASRIEGRYVTVWRRDPDERWRALFDGASLPASALGPGLERTPARSVHSRSGDLEAIIGTWKRAGDGPRHGVFITVRQKVDGGWTEPVDSAVPTSVPPTP